MSIWMHIQNFMKFYKFVLKILSGNEILMSIRGHNSVTNLWKMTGNNPNYKHKWLWKCVHNKIHFLPQHSTFLSLSHTTSIHVPTSMSSKDVSFSFSMPMALFVCSVYSLDITIFMLSWNVAYHILNQHTRFWYLTLSFMNIHAKLHPLWIII